MSNTDKEMDNNLANKKKKLTEEQKKKTQRSATKILRKTKRNAQISRL